MLHIFKSSPEHKFTLFTSDCKSELLTFLNVSAEDELSVQPKMKIRLLFRRSTKHLLILSAGPQEPRDPKLICKDVIFFLGATVKISACKIV